LQLERAVFPFKVSTTTEILRAIFIPLLVCVYRVNVAALRRSVDCLALPVGVSLSTGELVMKFSFCGFVRLSIAALCLVAAMFVLLSSPAVARQGQSMSNSNSEQGESPANVSAADKKFVKDAAQGGLAEVQLGRLATEKGSSPEVKAFGQRMVKDHTQANDQLKQVAESKGIEVPTDLNAKDKMLKDQLSNLSGRQFDQAYMQDMVKDHKQDIADFARESRTGNDATVKDFASKTLPTLRSHLRKAEKIAPTTQSAPAGSASEE
jgi:putative membrane protein